ncbi:hypothetical protein CR194_18070 [Salipaludibacillus keqinensis]|uniref:Uncharacterized protein n=1 Tax=Salipaludibacillus keqinensis TaxID=2045207 RepID=A0A323TE41_9BACI|nr:hypothetical protein CR194_18070 [Salipaludibacillus keqinensis]
MWDNGIPSSQPTVSLLNFQYRLQIFFAIWRKNIFQCKNFSQFKLLKGLSCRIGFLAWLLHTNYSVEIFKK